MRTRILIILISTIFFANVAVSASAESKPNSINWQEYSESIYDQASTEHRLLLIYGRALWCQWCKKTDEAIFADQTVIQLINDNFIPVMLDIGKNREAAVKFNITKMPSIFILDSSQNTLKELFGSISPADMRKAQAEAASEFKQQSSSDNSSHLNNQSAEKAPLLPNKTRQLLMEKQLLLYAERLSQGGGTSLDKKYIGRYSIEYAFPLVQHGNDIANKWLTLTLNNGMELLDPIWGGVYSYSTHGDWQHPDYEKSLLTQGRNIRIYANAYVLTDNQNYLHTAENITDYMLDFLMSPDGAFYNGQAAAMHGGKLNAEFYALNDALRRAAGIPAIDMNIYAGSNGEAIHALVDMYMVTGKKQYLDQAIRTSAWITSNLGLPDGGFKHSQKDESGLYLQDTLEMAAAYLDLYEATTDTQYLIRASRAVDFIDHQFKNPAGTSGFVAFTPGTAKQDTVYKIDIAENAKLAILSSLIYHINHDDKYHTIAEHALRYLTSPNIIQQTLPATVLLANHAVTTEPLKITIIGAKNDPDALVLFITALRFPSFYKIVQWYPSAADARKATGVTYPDTQKSAAFFCLTQRCSLPLYTKQEFDTIVTKLIYDQNKEKSTNVIANVTSLFPKYSLLYIQQFFSDMLLNRNWGLLILSFWSVGLLLAFTPCVFPLIMVLSTLLMSSQGTVSRQRRILLTLTYVLSLATTYAFIGYLAGALGLYLQVYLQSSIVLLSLSLLLAILAFSLLGGYKIHFPPAIQHYLISFNSFAASNTYIGAALMAMVVTLAASPCSAAPLVGILSIIAQIGDPAVGIVALFMTGLGMGTPLFIAGLLADIAAPKIQSWQHELQTLFGLLTLLISLWFASRVIPHYAFMLLLSSLSILTAIYLGVFKKVKIGIQGKFLKTFSIMFLIYGIALMTGTLIGNTNPLNPLAFNLNQTLKYQPSSLGVFQHIESEDDLRKFIEASKIQQRPVLIDFYASWCESCNRIEQEIFTDSRVISLMLKFNLVRIDLTSRSDASIEIARKFNVSAPPAILFYDSNGNGLEIRLYGDINIDEFSKTLNDVLERK